MQPRLLTLILVIYIVVCPLKAQNDTIKLTLDDAIELAQRQSLNAFLAENTYLSAYWDYQSNYRSTLFPKLSLNTELVGYSKGYTQVYNSVTDEYNMRYNERLNNNAGLSLSQNVFPTGGVLSVQTSLDHLYSTTGIDSISNSTRTYTSVPFQIVFSQPLNGYNSFKWKMKIDPLQFEQSKKNFISTQVRTARQTVSYFFSVISAQLNLTMSEFNYANADTLYRIGKGRFEIGTITQDELLDLELTQLNAQTSLTRARINLQKARNSLNSFLRMPPTSVINCLPPDDVPELKIDLEDALEKSFANNPDMIGYQIDLLNADRTVASAKGDRFDANLRVAYGVTGNYEDIPGAYDKPFDDSQSASLGIDVPIIDWGARKGNLLMAKSNREIVRYNVEQSKIDFEQNVFVTVLEFNLQEEQVSIAKKADQVGQLGYTVTKQRFMIGKVDVIKLNAARNSMVSARENYISVLQNFWDYYYNIQQITLFDYLNNEELEADFDKIVDEQRFDD